ncbi:MAG: kinase [Solirubrobacteraceae bacterium]|jgi:NAD+ kinase|nr:kinase [Solirubrobacteraceae bacterium]
MRARTATIVSHQRTEQVAPALQALIRAAHEHDVTLRLDPDETAKHRPAPADNLVLDAPVSLDVELCVVFGGDGTILRALRRFAGTGVPVFAVNYGEIGFLATIDPDEDDLDEGMSRAVSGDFETLTLPALAVETPHGQVTAINDVALHRRQGTRVAQLSYASHGEEVGKVRCDGLVLATPAGSTGYNLANGGPVMAWGVEGFAVSFISPHSLTARSLVVAPSDLLSVHNRSRDPVDISVDGRLAGELAPGEAISATFVPEATDLAQVPGSSFYRRLRDKFGRLAT